MTRTRQLLLAMLVIIGGATVVQAQSIDDDLTGCCYSGKGAKCCGSIYCIATSTSCNAL